MSTSFTPGPWAANKIYLSEVEAQNGLTVASCWHKQAAGETIRVTGVNPCSLEESAANARLIAAAPELLEALEKIAGLRKPQFFNPDDMAAEAVNIARAAIAKATGVQS